MAFTASGGSLRSALPGWLPSVQPSKVMPFRQATVRKANIIALNTGLSTRARARRRRNLTRQTTTNCWACSRSDGQPQRHKSSLVCLLLLLVLVHHARGWLSFIAAALVSLLSGTRVAAIFEIAADKCLIHNNAGALSSPGQVLCQPA